MGAEWTGNQDQDQDQDQGSKATDRSVRPTFLFAHILCSHCRVRHLSHSLRKVGFHERRSIGILILDMGSQSPHPLFAKGARRTVYVGRTLLSVAFGFDLSLKPKTGAAWTGESRSRPRSKATDRSVRPTFFCATSFLLIFSTRCEPEPGVVFRNFYEAAADWVLADVFSFVFETFLRSWDVVEGFFLPDWAART
jgi:hypothetical protein